MMYRRIFLALLLVSGTSRASEVTPIIVDSTLPVMAGIGLPQASSTQLLEPKQIQFSLFGLVQSHSILRRSQAPNEELQIDAESRQLGIRADYGLSQKWNVGFTVKQVFLSGGDLDSLIDNWHDLFGLPEGDRPRFGRDQLNVLYRNNQGEQIINESISGTSDIELRAQYQWLDLPNYKLAWQFGLSIPVGSSKALVGSDKTDAHIAALFSNDKLFGFEKWGWHANLGYLFVSDDQLFGIETRSNWYSSVGLHWQATERWKFKTQFDGHGGLFRSSINELSTPAQQVAVAAEFQFNRGSVYKPIHLEVYFTEDISVGKSADFAFGINIRFRR